MSDQDWSKSGSPHVFLVILNWKRPDLTLACLESVMALDYPKECLHIVVVDNASGDDSVALIRDAFPEVSVLANNENLGFAGGNNVGIDFAMIHGADYILLLNNDTVVAPDLVSRLIAVGESDAAIGVVTPTILYYDDPERIWCAGAAIDWKMGTTQRLRSDLLFDMNSVNLEDVDFASGCAICVKRSAIERCGNMDSRFFLYYEETDWCVRIRRAGFRCVLVASAKVWHKVSSSVEDSSPLQVYYMTRNRLLFLEKSLPAWLSSWSILSVILRELLFVLIATIKPSNHRKVIQRWARLKGIYDYVRRKFGRVRMGHVSATTDK